MNCSISYLLKHNFTMLDHYPMKLRWPRILNSVRVVWNIVISEAIILSRPKSFMFTKSTSAICPKY